MLFAYKTFSHTIEHERFRVVFALQHKITDSFTAKSIVSIFMKIFENCDEACKDSARLFFGGKGLLHLASKPREISLGEIILAFTAYMLTNMAASTTPGNYRSSTLPTAFVLKRIIRLQIMAVSFQKQVLSLSVLVLLTS